MPKYQKTTVVDAIQFENEFEVMAWVKQFGEDIDFMKDGDCLMIMGRTQNGLVPLCNIVKGDYLVHEKGFRREEASTFEREYQIIMAFDYVNNAAMLKGF